MFHELDFEQMLKDEAAQCYDVRSPEEVEEIVTITRIELYNRGVACGAKAIRTRMDESYGIRPLPSERTIARMLARNGLTYGRLGWRDGDEKWLPASAMRAKPPDQEGTNTHGNNRSALTGDPEGLPVTASATKTE